MRGKMDGLQKGTGSTAWSCVGWLLLPDPLLQEIVLLNQDDLVTPNGATSFCPQILSNCLFVWQPEQSSVSSWAAGCLKDWGCLRADGNVPIFLSPALRDLTETHSAQNAEEECPKNAIANAAGKASFFIHFDFSGFFFPAWNPGLDLVCTERKGVGCLLMSLCPTSPTSRTSGIYGHLSLKLQSPAAASAHSPQSRGWAPSQALCTLQHC